MKKIQLKKLSPWWVLTFFEIGILLFSLAIGQIGIFMCAMGVLAVEIFFELRSDEDRPPLNMQSAAVGLLAAGITLAVIVGGMLNPMGRPKSIGTILGMEADKVQSVHARLELSGGGTGEAMLQSQEAAQVARVVSGWKAVKRERYGYTLPKEKLVFVATVDGFQKSWVFYISGGGVMQYEGNYYEIEDEGFNLAALKRRFEGSWTDGPVSLFFPSLPNVKEITAIDSQAGSEYTLEGEKAAGLAAALSGLEISLDYGLELDPSILRYSIEFEGGVISLAKNYMVIEPAGKEAVSCHPDGSYDMEAMAALLTQ